MEPLPTYIQIEPVGQCNLRCQMCAIQFRHDGPPYGPLAFMRWDDFTRLVDEFVGLRELHLQGLGEPMMHPRFFDMVAYAAGKGIRVTTNSNLTLLNARAPTLRHERPGLPPRLDRRRDRRDLRANPRPRPFRPGRPQSRLAARRSPATGRGPAARSDGVGRHAAESARIARSGPLRARMDMEELFVQHLCHDFGEVEPPRPLPADARVRASADAAGRGPGARRASTSTRPASWRGNSASISACRGPRPRFTRRARRAAQRCDWPWTGAYVSYQGWRCPAAWSRRRTGPTWATWRPTACRAVWNGEAYEAFRGAARLG